jgi:glutamine cyclotransferase
MVPRYLLLASYFTTLFFLAGCESDVKDEQTRMVVLKVVSPANEAQFIEGQNFELTLDILKDNQNAILHVFLNDNKILEKRGVRASEKLTIESKNIHLGFNELQIKLIDYDNQTHIEKRKIIVFTKTEPEILVPVIKNSFPHNPNHYTQGYEFEGGRLFEGTGQLGQSIISEILLNSGEVVRKKENDPNIFGEGITILNNEIYQLTWQNRVCYVYNLQDFSKKKEFKYDGEGWGLANDGKVLYMSNGSSRITVRDAYSFDILRTFDVFSNRQEIRALNELEYVDGFLYANVYQQNYIAKIDPKDGRVVGLIDCEQLVNEGKGNGDVLNGIAYNSKNSKFYLTGKNWEKVFEVDLQKK